MVETRRIGETNIGVAYAGRWQDARHNGYADRAVLYSQTDGATATYPFYGEVGGLGRTRRADARHSAGRRSTARSSQPSTCGGVSFKPRVALFEQSWKRVGDHTLTITVVGNGRPVAIDEFVITR